jgi:hypothetical protein
LLVVKLPHKIDSVPHVSIALERSIGKDRCQAPNLLLLQRLLTEVVAFLPLLTVSVSYLLRRV